MNKQKMILTSQAAASVINHRFNQSFEPYEIVLHNVGVLKGLQGYERHILGRIDTLKTIAYLSPCGKYYVRVDNGVCGEVADWLKNVEKKFNRTPQLTPYMGGGGQVNFQEFGDRKEDYATKLMTRSLVSNDFLVVHDWKVGANSYKILSGTSKSCPVTNFVDRTDWSKAEIGYL